MRRLCLAGILLLAGCQNVAGPFSMRKPERVDDPRLSIPEQERRGRDRLSYPETSADIVPRTYTEFPGPHGR